MPKNVLNQLQSNTLQALSQTDLAKVYYWTGGTALAYKYLPARLSEDLDFFSFDLQTDENLLIELNKLKKTLNIVKINFTKNLNRRQFVLYFKGRQKLKLEFVFFSFKNLFKPKLDKKLNIRIDSLTDIAVNKTLATFQRCEPKDIFDLYLLLTAKKLKLKQLIKSVHKKFAITIDQADLGAKILAHFDSLKEIKPLIINKEKFNNIEKIKKFFTQKSINYLKNYIIF